VKDKYLELIGLIERLHRQCLEVIKSDLDRQVLRDIRRMGPTVEAEKIEIECPPRIRDLLQQFEQEYLDELEKKFQKKVEIRANGSLRPDQYKVAGRISEPVQQGTKPAGRKRGGRSRSKKAAKK
jgi:hypothetical protein